MSDFHARMMNIPCETPTDYNVNVGMGFKLGHKQARHAAAEIANEADAELTRLRSDLAAMREALEPLVAACKMALKVADSGADWWIDCPDRGGLDAEMLRAALAKGGQP